MWVTASRWDRDPLARAVTKLVSNDKKETLASAPTLQKALALMTDAQQQHHVHPHHIMLPLDAEAKSILGALHSPTPPLLPIQSKATVGGPAWRSFQLIT